MKRITCLLFIFFAFLPLWAASEEQPITATSMDLRWNNKLNSFEALFSVTNNSNEAARLLSIIRFSAKNRRRWREVRLPTIPPQQTERFKIVFPTHILLKNDYDDVGVIIFRNGYKDVVDNTNRHFIIKTERSVVNREFIIKVTKIPVNKNAGTGYSLATPSQTVLRPGKTGDLIVQSRATTSSPGVLYGYVTPEMIHTVGKGVSSESIRPTSGNWIEIDTDRLDQTIAQQARTRILTGESPFEEKVQTEVTNAGPDAPSTSTKPPQTVIESKEISIPELVATDVSNQQVKLTWKPIPNIQEYSLYWSKIPVITKKYANRIEVKGERYVQQNLDQDQAYYYAVSARVGNQEGPLSNEIVVIPKIRESDIPIEGLISGITVDAFTDIKPIEEYTIDIADMNVARTSILKRAQALKTLDIDSKDELISLYVAEGKSEDLAELLSDQLDKNPESIDLSLSLSKVYHKQGNTTAALNVLNASLNRISLSARVALNQELKTSVQEGKTTISGQSEEAFLANEFNTLGLTLLAEEKFSDALQAFKSLQSLAPDYPMAKYNQGLSRRGMKQYSQAKQNFISQSSKSIDAGDQLKTLDAMTSVLPFSLQTRDVEFAVNKYNEISPKVTSAQRRHINQQLERLKSLADRAINRDIDTLSDLVVGLPELIQFKEIQPGQDISVNLMVRNQGKYPSNDFNVYYQLVHSSGTSYEISLPDKFDSLPAIDGVVAWNKRLAVPAGALKGTYHVLVNVEQEGGKDEVSLQNNKVTTASNISVIAPIAELAITFKRNPTPGRIIQDEGIPLNLAVINNGYLQSPEFKVVYELENENGDTVTLNKSDTFSRLEKRDGLLIENKTVDIPESIVSGLYNFKAKLELKDETAEVNKSNNQIESGFVYQIEDRFDGRPLAGIAFYQALSKHSPDTISYKIKIARYQDILGQTDNALNTLSRMSSQITSQLREYRKRDSDTAVPISEEHLNHLKNELRSKGQAYAKQGNHRRALVCYQSLSALDPEFPHIHRLTGQARLGLKQFALAKREFYQQSQLTPDLQSLTDVTDALTYAGDSDLAARTRASLLKLKTAEPTPSSVELSQAITLLDTMINQERDKQRQEGSDLLIAFENPPGAVAIQPGDNLELEFSLSNLGDALSNPVSVHYQFINQNGDIFDSDVVTGFDKLDPGHGDVFWDEDLLVPNNIIGGTYLVRATLEFEKNKEDKNEANNFVNSDALFVYSEPDIALTNFSYKIQERHGDVTVAKAQLSWENIGGATATNSILKIYLKNINEPSDTQIITEEKLADIPALSDTIARAIDLVIPQITTNSRYQLIAEITSTGNQTERLMANNLFVSAGLISKKMAPLAITGVLLDTDVAYPGKTVDVEITLRNSTEKTDIRNTVITLELVDSNGIGCCGETRTINSIPSSIIEMKSEKNPQITDYIFKTTFLFPEVLKGEYTLAAILNSYEGSGDDLFETLVKSASKLHYAEPLFKLIDFYPIQDTFVPGKTVEFTISVLANGKSETQPEKLDFYLEGNRSILIGSVDIESLPPDENETIIRKSIQLPADIEVGTYVLQMKKQMTPQGKEQSLRFRKEVNILGIQQIEPMVYESFRKSEPPLFAWNSIDGQRYRLAFSTDPSFKNEGATFRIPSQDWLDSKRYQPNSGEWNMIWLLSQRQQKKVYWMVEAISNQKMITRGVPQRILLK